MAGIGMSQGNFHPSIVFVWRGSFLFCGDEIVVLVLGSLGGLILLLGVLALVVFSDLCFGFPPALAMLYSALVMALSILTSW